MASAIRTRLCLEPASLKPMRPRRAVLLTPPSLIPAFFQNVAKSCICHTSENSPVTPIIATDPKMRSCKSCVCHTCDPLPRPQSHPLLFQFVAAPHCKFAPLFSSSCRMLPPQPFSFHVFAWLPGGGRGQARKPAPAMFSFKNPCTVSPPSFPASAFPSIPILDRDGAAACGDSRISHQSPVTNHQSPQLCGGFSRHSPLPP